MFITNLLRSLFSVKTLVVILTAFVIGVSGFYFWKLNGKNVTFCVTHSKECSIARLQNAKEVSEKVAALEGGK